MFSHFQSVAGRSLLCLQDYKMIKNKNKSINHFFILSPFDHSYIPHLSQFHPLHQPQQTLHHVMSHVMAMYDTHPAPQCLIHPPCVTCDRVLNFPGLVSWLHFRWDPLLTCEEDDYIATCIYTWGSNRVPQVALVCHDPEFPTLHPCDGCGNPSSEAMLPALTSTLT